MSKEMKVAIVGAVITGIFAIIAACIGGPLIIELLRGDRDDPVAYSSPTSRQSVLAATNTPQPAVPTSTPQPAVQPAAAVPKSTPTWTGPR